MDTNEEKKILCRDEVYQVVGAAIEVLNGIGHGLHEKPYENALIVEFALRQIPYQQQPGYDVLYNGQRVGLFIPDLVVFEKIVVDTKVIDRIRFRTRPDVELLANHQSEGGAHSKLQTRKT